MAVILVAGLAQAFAQNQQRLARPKTVGKPETISASTITILTDGIADPQARLPQAMRELAARLNEGGKWRVLPLLGPGGVANVRDMLYLRGVDLATLNGDIFAYLALSGLYPEARRRIRYVTHLADRKVYLIARKHIASVHELKKRKVVVLGEYSGSHVTARAVFGLLKLDAEFLPLKPDAVLDKTALAGGEAVLLLGRDLDRLRFDAADWQDLHLLEIPQTPALAKIYGAAEIQNGEVPGLAAGRPVATVKTAALLAALDGNAKQYRYQKLSTFVGAFFAALPELRRHPPATLWQEANIHAVISDWQRFRPAERLSKTIPVYSVGRAAAAPPASPPIVALKPPAPP
ncbi:MAG: hypothetical protein ACREC6_00815, partial [Hyphomicrobiaceae bacterium]